MRPARRGPLPHEGVQAATAQVRHAGGEVADAGQHDDVACRKSVAVLGDEAPGAHLLQRLGDAGEVAHPVVDDAHARGHGPDGPRAVARNDLARHPLLVEVTDRLGRVALRR